MSGKRLSRRDLLKVAQVGGVAGVAAVTAGVAMSSDGTQRKRAVCRLCTMHCGTVATVRGNALLKVEGDPRSSTRGFLCLNGHALPEVVHAPDRLLHPLIRRGGRLEEASWDEALAYVAERLHVIADRWGPRALFVQTGWPFVRHPLVALLQRFVHAFGSPNLATVASLCEASGRMGRALTCGSDYLPNLERARTLTLWGANPAHATPPFAHLVGAFGREPGKNLVVIDPVRHELARAATLHLQVRPGTDGALALAFIDLLIRRGGAAPDVARSDPQGFAALAGAAAEMGVGRAAELCGVAASDIERALGLMHDGKPTAIWSGLGIEHHVHGVQTVRAVSCLEALLGSLGDGAVELRHRATNDTGEPLPQLYRLATAEPVPPQAPDRPVGYADYPLYDVYNRQAHGMLLPRAVLEDTPYPVRALILVGCNALVSHPDAERMRRTFEALELIVTIDPFLSASGRAAHVVLPASTFAESAVIEDRRGAAGRAAYQGEATREALIVPRGESRPDWRIVFDLAAALGLARYFPWRSLEEALAVPMHRWLRDPDRELFADPAAAPTFPTRSGHVELASPTLARFGHDAVPRFSAAQEQPDYPLHLVTGPRTRPYINSQLRTTPSVARHLREPTLSINPRTAAELGIAHGELVEVTTATGQVRLHAEVTDSTRTDTVVMPHGWESANANLLVDGERRDPISGFPALRSQRCRVRPV